MKHKIYRQDCALKKNRKRYDIFLYIDNHHGNFFVFHSYKAFNRLTRNNLINKYLLMTEGEKRVLSFTSTTWHMSDYLSICLERGGMSHDEYWMYQLSFIKLTTRVHIFIPHTIPLTLIFLKVMGREAKM